MVLSQVRLACIIRSQIICDLYRGFHGLLAAFSTSTLLRSIDLQIGGNLRLTASAVAESYTTPHTPLDTDYIFLLVLFACFRVPGVLFTMHTTYTSIVRNQGTMLIDRLRTCTCRVSWELGLGGQVLLFYRVGLAAALMRI